MSETKYLVTELLDRAGITVGGSTYFDIQVHDERFFDRVAAAGGLGLGESYMDGWWDVERLDEFFARVLRARLDKAPELGHALWPVLRARFVNMQSKGRSRKVAREHYDLGNDFYADMLDSRMLYTCGFWDGARTLEQAQQAKCELICAKLALTPEDSVLDLGCGWGGFAKYAAQRYGCRVTGYNISAEQVRYATEHAGNLPITYVLDDYRNVEGRFDKIVSIGLFEHVGAKNLGPAMQIVSRCLEDDGLFLLHTIGRNSSAQMVDPWIDKYIFPGGVVPSIVQLADAFENLFVPEHFHSFGQDYDKTLMAWYANFSRNWEKYHDRYGDRFYRMWSYYLLSCAGSFRARSLQLWQWVFSKQGIVGGYDCMRWRAAKQTVDVRQLTT